MSATQRTFQLEDLMWQRDWDQWRVQNFPDAKPAEYLSKKLLTNFTADVHKELLEYENQLIVKLNSKNNEPEQKSEQNNNKTESEKPSPSPSTIPSRKDAVRKKLRQRKEERLKNALIPSRISKNQTAEDSRSSQEQENNENTSRLESPRSFYNHGNKTPTDSKPGSPSAGSPSGSSPSGGSPSSGSPSRSQLGTKASGLESQNTCPLGGLFNTASRLENENISTSQHQNKYIPRRTDSKFKTRDDSDDDSLQKALSNLKIRHHA